MKFKWVAMTVPIAVCLLANVALPAECICAKSPMYQVPGGWFHFANVCRKAEGTETGCTYEYSTGLVRPSPSYNESCDSVTTCGTCTALGGSATIHDFHFTVPLKGFADLDTHAEFRGYLESHSGTMPISEYNNYTFEEPRVVSLKRSIGGHVSTFLAVIHKMKRNSQNTHAFIGVEIESAGSATVTPVTSQCNAVHSEKNIAGAVVHRVVPGVLQVQLNAVEVAYIRLSKTTNTGASYTPCFPSTPLNTHFSLVDGGVAPASGLTQTSDVAQICCSACDRCRRRNTVACHAQAEAYCVIPHRRCRWANRR